MGDTSVRPHGAWSRPGGGAAFGGKADIAGVDSLVTQIDETTKKGAAPQFARPAHGHLGLGLDRAANEVHAR